MQPRICLQRRAALTVLAAASLPVRAQPLPAMRVIPASGERIPALGLGSWITFNVGRDRALRDNAMAVMKAFFDGGGRLIDSSPMYGSSQDVIGEGLARLARGNVVFAADKVWTSAVGAGAGQIETTRRLWGLPRFDLLQVHNLLAWQEHLATLRAMQAARQLRYVGVTTSHGRRHGELETILKTEKLDFVQLSYNPVAWAVLGIASLHSAPARAARLALALAALAWAAVAWLYLWDGLAGIHWLGRWWALAFWLQALAWVAWAAMTRPSYGASGPRRALGWLLMAAAALWPALPLLLGRSPWQAEWVGMAPDPTVLMSLGLLLCMRPTRRWAAGLLAVPLGWCVFSGATLWAMAQPHALVLPLAVAAVAVALLHQRR